MNRPLISIIIPVYNAECYIRRCIESVLSQTYKEIQVILINDGSTDNTLSILEEYSISDSRIQLINKDNSGVSKTRNIGIDISDGEYIGFVDAADYTMLLRRLQQMWLVADIIRTLIHINMRYLSMILY